MRTFQQTKALTRMTVLDNMTLAAPRQPGESLVQLVTGPRLEKHERAIRERARDLLELVHLGGHADEYAGTLSGGQRKLLEFARALMLEPRMVMLDEPMAGVNPTLGLQLLDHVQSLRSSNGTTFLLIEHDLEVVMNVSDVVLVRAPAGRDRLGRSLRGALQRGRDRRLPGQARDAEADQGRAVSSQPLLSVRGLSAGYGEQNIIHEVSIEVRRGGFVSVIGPNGAGSPLFSRRSTG